MATLIKFNIILKDSKKKQLIASVIPPARNTNITRMFPDMLGLLGLFTLAMFRSDLFINLGHHSSKPEPCMNLNRSSIDDGTYDFSKTNICKDDAYDLILTSEYS